MIIEEDKPLVERIVPLGGCRLTSALVLRAWGSKLGHSTLIPRNLSCGAVSSLSTASNSASRHPWLCLSYFLISSDLHRKECNLQVDMFPIIQLALAIPILWPLYERNQNQVRLLLTIFSEARLKLSKIFRNWKLTPILLENRIQQIFET